MRAWKETIMKRANSDSTCEYQIELSDDKVFIIFRANAPVTCNTTKAFKDKAFELAGPHGSRSFLLDVRDFVCKLDPLQACLFARDLEDMGRERIYKQAIVVSQSDDTYHFVEIVTRNRGINTRIFTNYMDAVAWLKM